MTERGLYEAVLFELRKAKSPHIHLEEFNYFGNKGIQEYANELYNVYETTQQTSDGLAALTSFVEYKIIGNAANYSGNSMLPIVNKPILRGNRYNSRYVQIPLPIDYFHLLNCVTDVITKFNYTCYKAGFVHSIGAKKLNSDSASHVMTNAWLKPAYNRTFFKELDHYNAGKGALTPSSNNVNVTPDLQIYFGMSNKFELDTVYCEYLRQPRIINLLEAALELPTDTSALLEFPPYVCNEIVKRVVKLILENSKDPRIQSFVPTNSSIK